MLNISNWIISPSWRTLWVVKTYQSFETSLVQISVSVSVTRKAAAASRSFRWNIQAGGVGTLVEKRFGRIQSHNFDLMSFNTQIVFTKLNLRPLKSS